MPIMEKRNGETNPFADYMWMGEMEKFDEEIEAQIEKEYQEEEFIRSCIEQLLEEEEEQTVYFNSANGLKAHTTRQKQPSNYENYNIDSQMSNLHLSNTNQANMNFFIPSAQPPSTNTYFHNQYYYDTKPIPSKSKYSIPSQYPLQNSNTSQPPKQNGFEKQWKMNPDAQEFVPRSSANNRTMVATHSQNGSLLPSSAQMNGPFHTSTSPVNGMLPLNVPSQPNGFLSGPPPVMDLSMMNGTSHLPPPTRVNNSSNDAHLLNFVASTSS